jgi:hypothetical protein
MTGGVGWITPASRWPARSRWRRICRGSCRGLPQVCACGDLSAAGSNSVGPGVYDIHSPRAPAVDEITSSLREALKSVPAERLWVNPICGLKTRTTDEVTVSLQHLVAAAQQVRTAEPVELVGRVEPCDRELSHPGRHRAEHRHPPNHSAHRQERCSELRVVSLPDLVSRRCRRSSREKR